MHVCNREYACMHVCNRAQDIVSSLNHPCLSFFSLVLTNIALVMFSDFAKILREAAIRPLDGVHVLIERAPECKSIYVSGFLENTPKEQVETHFDQIGALEYVVFNPAWDKEGKDKRAIVYFKEKKSKSKKELNKL